MSLERAHSSACVFPGSSREKPVERMAFVWASVITHPTQKAVEVGSHCEAWYRASDMREMCCSSSTVDVVAFAAALPFLGMINLVKRSPAEVGLLLLSC